MRIPLLLLLAGILFSGCRKDELPKGCFLTSYSYGSNQRFDITYNNDGSISGFYGIPMRAFNSGTLLTVFDPSDTITLDASGRLREIRQPHADVNRQTTRYEYDALNQITRAGCTTTTSPGNVYFTDLDWNAGDLVSYRYSMQGWPGSSESTLTYYDTLAPHQFLTKMNVHQVGTIFSRHLPKAFMYNGERTQYTYSFDDDGRVSQRVSKDDAGRVLKTEYYSYSCY